MFKFVLPNLTSVLQQQGGTLPQTTIILIAATNFFNKFWWILGIGMVGGYFGIKYYINTHNGRYQWDTLKIHLPIIGDIFKKIYLARFSRNLSTLVLGGIPIIKALEIVAQLVNNVIYRDILLESINQISAGKSISEGLAGHPEFPNIVTQMVHVGEQTAQLDDILSKLAGFYEKEVDTKIGTLTTLLEPLIMIILGIGVGILVAGVLLPIYNLASAGG
jgi:type IV pilus assembly protein PilC